MKNGARIFNYKFLSTLSLISLGIVITSEIGHALVRPLGNSSPASKQKFFYGNNGIRIPITSQSSINSGGNGDISNHSQLSTNPKPTPPPIPKRSSSILFMKNFNRSLISSSTSSGTKISSDSKDHKSSSSTPVYREHIGGLTKIIETNRHAYKTANKMFDNVLRQLNNTTK